VTIVTATATSLSGLLDMSLPYVTLETEAKV